MRTSPRSLFFAPFLRRPSYLLARTIAAFAAAVYLHRHSKAVAPPTDRAGRFLCNDVLRSVLYT